MTTTPRKPEHADRTSPVAAIRPEEAAMTTWAGYRVKVTLKRGYELPGWHQPDHDALESAQSEVTKLRQWDGDAAAIRGMSIEERFQ